MVAVVSVLVISVLWRMEMIVSTRCVDLKGIHSIIVLLGQILFLWDPEVLQLQEEKVIREVTGWRVGRVEWKWMWGGRQR